MDNLLLRVFAATFLFFLVVKKLNAQEQDTLSYRVRFINSISGNMFRQAKFLISDSQKDSICSVLVSDDRGEAILKIPQKIKEVYAKSDTGVLISDKVTLTDPNATLVFDMKQVESLKQIVLEADKNVIRKSHRTEYPVQRLKTNEPQIVENFLKTIPGISSKEGGAYKVYGIKNALFYLNEEKSDIEIIKKLPLRIIEKVEVLTDNIDIGVVDNNVVVINIVTKSNTTDMGGTLRASAYVLNPTFLAQLNTFLIRKDLLMTFLVNPYLSTGRTQSNSVWETKKATNLDKIEEFSSAKWSVIPKFLTFGIQKEFHKKLKFSGKFVLTGIQKDFHSDYEVSKYYKDIGTTVSSEKTNSQTSDNTFYIISQLTYTHNDKHNIFLNAAYERKSSTDHIDNVTLANTSSGYKRLAWSDEFFLQASSKV